MRHLIEKLIFQCTYHVQYCHFYPVVTLEVFLQYYVCPPRETTDCVETFQPLGKIPQELYLKPLTTWNPYNFTSFAMSHWLTNYYPITNFYLSPKPNKASLNSNMFVWIGVPVDYIAYRQLQSVFTLGYFICNCNFLIWSETLAFTHQSCWKFRSFAEPMKRPCGPLREGSHELYVNTNIFS